MATQKIRIRLKAYDTSCSISRPARSSRLRSATGAKVVGPSRSGRTRITAVHRAALPARGQEVGEQLRSDHKRLLDILEPTQQTLDALMKLDLSAGVDVEIKS